MIKLQNLTIAILFGFLSCDNKKTETSPKNENVNVNQTTVDTVQKIETKIAATIPETVKSFIVDNYAVTDKMLQKESEDNPNFTINSGKTFSFEKAWFSNDILNQTLIVQLYTDYHRLLIYHFTDKDIPTDLVNEMELHIDGGELASDGQKRNDFKGFIKQATKIESSYFISEKGFKIGDAKQKAINIYGKPDKEFTDNGIEKLQWNFIGDAFYDRKTKLNGKPLAKDSYGHQVTMYFRDEKLIAQILFNDIP